MTHKPPEHTRIKPDCSFLAEDGSCCHAKNYLRDEKTDSYCVVLLDEWLRSMHPEYDDHMIRSAIKEILVENRQR